MKRKEGRKKERIAELVGMLPMFIGVLLDGIVIDTPYKMNESEEKTLIFLHKNEGSSMAEYSKKVGLTSGSFTGVVDRLVQKGLVERASFCADRRKYALILTGKGKNIAKKIDTQFCLHIAKKLTLLEEGELNNLNNALEVLVTSMENLKARKG